MHWLKAYGLRFVEDVAAFAVACLLSMFAALPLVVFGYWGLFSFAYVAIIVFSAMGIFIVSVATAVFDSYRWKFAIYCLVLTAVVYSSAGSLFETYPVSRAAAFTPLLLVQIVFGMGVFYYVVQRKQIAERWSVWRAAHHARG